MQRREDSTNTPHGKVDSVSAKRGGSAFASLRSSAVDRLTEGKRFRGAFALARRIVCLCAARAGRLRERRRFHGAGTTTACQRRSAVRRSDVLFERSQWVARECD